MGFLYCRLKTHPCHVHSNPTKVKLVDNILTPEECAAICSEEPACAFWSHLADKSDCKIWSSDAVRLVFIFNPINVPKRGKILHINKNTSCHGHCYG